MTDLRTAAQQALEAMSSFESGTNGLYEGEFAQEIAALKAALVEDAMQKFTDVSQELEAALAEPVQDHFRDVTKMVQEPVAWEQFHEHMTGPFYRAPPQRKPLPASEIVTMYDESPRGDSDMIAFARAVERAHGIGGQP